ncbi:M48 family metalloprotease [Sphingomonas sp. JC676]|uniref:M48 family metalloprotease n=1 Tax=Sphingomonas sp. JC676 TaxID=2768065 RepID=UPI00165847D4|nr:M48 family metallopeptidase [Sphingomonas sp. JC676]MBC9030930.1 M48 family metalloprotease [Sphingomonas sp. JC676]
MSDDAALFEQLRASDLEMATIGWRLASSNAPLCDVLEPGLGLQIHTLDQFAPQLRASARSHFKFSTAVAIEGVIPGGPAAQAGLRPDDSLVRIGPVDIAASAGKPGTTQRLVAVQLAVAKLPPAETLEIQAIRDGAPLTVTVRPIPACRSRFELELADDFSASADGSMVQVSSKLLDTYRGDRAVAAIAHEFSHNILHHRVRLEARGVTFGMLAGFGGNVKYFRQTEIQADILSIYLLANAGYDPKAAPDFWRDFGPKHAGSVFNSRSHPHWRDRIATLEAEIAKVQADPARPHVSKLIAERDQPLDGDWQSLLVRHR